jgi:hypothetical protein
MTQLLIDLTESERKRLTELSRRVGKSESAIAREAVTRHLQQLDFSEPETDALSSAFGLWKNLGIDSTSYQQTLRSEWDQRNGML